MVVRYFEEQSDHVVVTEIYEKCAEGGLGTVVRPAAEPMCVRPGGPMSSLLEIPLFSLSVFRCLFLVGIQKTQCFYLVSRLSFLSLVSCSYGRHPPVSFRAFLITPGEIEEEAALREKGGERGRRSFRPSSFSSIAPSPPPLLKTQKSLLSTPRPHFKADTFI